MRVATTTASGPVGLLDRPAKNTENSHTIWTESWGLGNAMDYGLDPGDAAARAGFMSRIRNVHLNPDEVKFGKFGAYDEAFMFRQGEDLLVTRTDGTFVSMYPGASTSSWFKNAEVFPH
jgi:hypothetical protein